MDNTVNLASVRQSRRCARKFTAREAFAQAEGLLSDTIESIRDRDGRLDACHLAAVEKIKALLCVAYGDDSFEEAELAALSLIELARFALKAGPEAFEGAALLDYGHSICEALVAAQARLREVANG